MSSIASSVKSSVSSASSSTCNEEPEEIPNSLRQFIVLLVARIVEPIAYVMPFVFVNQSQSLFLHSRIAYLVHKKVPLVIEHLEPDVPKENIGAYSGAIESLFALFQFLTSYQWGKLSDHPSVGRKVCCFKSCLSASS